MSPPRLRIPPVLVWTFKCLFLASLSSAFHQKYYSSNITTIPVQKRMQRLMPLFQVVSFPNDMCAGGGSRNGTCYLADECLIQGGIASGNCAAGFGVCCIFELPCGSTTSQNNSYIQQSSMALSTSSSTCVYNICKMSTDICRIRLEFNTFVLSGPTTGAVVSAAAVPGSNGGAIGDCVTDSFSFASPGKMGSPVICGFNSGQHMIVDASSSTGCNTASFSLGTTSKVSRRWDITVKQYACGDSHGLGGPTGCLQYFTGPSGSVASFNFPVTSSTVAGTVTHLSNQHYTMCWRQEIGKCSICWVTAITGTSTTAQDSFGLSTSKDSTITASSNVNARCNTDYLAIPLSQTAPVISGTIPTATFSRHCGRFFAADAAESTISQGSVCTQVRPFLMSFHTDSDEITAAGSGPNRIADTNELGEVPGGIVGFMFNWAQMDC